jgi:hypothetical protein
VPKYKGIKPKVFGWLGIVCGVASIISFAAYSAVANQAVLNIDRQAAALADHISPLTLMTAAMAIAFGICGYAANGWTGKPWPLGLAAVCIGVVGLVLAFIGV